MLAPVKIGHVSKTIQALTEVLGESAVATYGKLYSLIQDGKANTLHRDNFDKEQVKLATQVLKVHTKLKHEIAKHEKQYALKKQLRSPSTI